MRRMASDLSCLVRRLRIEDRPGSPSQWDDYEVARNISVSMPPTQKHRTVGASYFNLYKSQSCTRTDTMVKAQHSKSGTVTRIRKLH